MASDAAAADGPRGATVSVAAGVFRPSDETLRSLYGDHQWPLMIQLEVPVAGPVSAFAGARRLTRDGTTIATSPAVDDGSFPIELTVTSFRVGGAASATRRRARFFVAVGADYVRSSERWPAADLSYDANGWGVVAQAGTDVPVWNRLSIRGLVEFSAVRAGDNPETGEKVALGGLTLAAGVSYRFGR